MGCVLFAGDNVLAGAWTMCVDLGTNTELSTGRSDLCSSVWKTGDKVRKAFSVRCLTKSRLSTIHSPYYKHYLLNSLTSMTRTRREISL